MLDLIYLLFASFLSLAKSSFIISIALVPFVLFSLWVKKKLAGKGMSWIKETFLAVFATCFIIITIAYFYFPVSSMLSGVATTPLERPIADYLLFIIISFIRNIFVSLAVALLLMPFSLIGAFIFSYVSGRLSKRKASSASYAISLFLSIWLTSAIALLLLLSLFRDSVAAVLYFIFFAFG